MRSNQSETYDVVLANGRVIDPETYLDGKMHVGIKGDRIVAVSESPLKGKEVIDASGLIVSPGFIDLHSHGQSSSLGQRNKNEAKEPNGEQGKRKKQERQTEDLHGQAHPDDGPGPAFRDGDRAQRRQDRLHRHVGDFEAVYGSPSLRDR
ncbi:MAG: hypothetical protein OET55_05660 [Desulfuromonadales bacterium]|nr:hypothetical protein [Desulfuromonadales bacterium]